MQTVSNAFQARSAAGIRDVSKQVSISFDKQYLPGITFYTIGVSAFDGNDFFRGEGTVVQDFEKYVYQDFTERLLSAEYDRGNEDLTNALTLATADLTFDNKDDYFTPGNVNSPLYPNVLPKRPVRIMIGFKGEMVQVFAGLTQGQPVIDRKSGTARIHCVDYLSYLMDIPLDEEVMYTNQRTDQIIAALLQLAGFDPTQYILETGSVIIPFAYFKKGDKIGDMIRKISQAELGNVRMDELGIVRFFNRESWADRPVDIELTDLDSVIEESTPTISDVINVVEVIADNRAVQELQPVYQHPSVVEIKAGESVTVFGEFTDDDGPLPVTDVNDPVADVANDSGYIANSALDGSGDDVSGDISLTESYSFGTSYKMVFTNSGSDPAYLIDLIIYGTPARVVDGGIYLRLQDDASVGVREGYDELVYRIENEFIQDLIAARSIAQILLNDRAEVTDTKLLTIQGRPQLQVGDVSHYTGRNVDDNYFLTNINGILDERGFIQHVRVNQRTINQYWRVGMRPFDGDFVFAP